MRISTLLSGAALVAGYAAQVASAAELQAPTLKAWNTYLDEVNIRLEQRAASTRHFLWTDESENRSAQVRRGEVVVAPVLTHGTQDVPNGLIHHWIGALFLPGTTIGSFWAVLHDYDNYKNTYRPAVTASKTLACSESGQQFLMIWKRKVLFVNAAIEGRYQSHDVILDARRGYSVADSTEIRQIAEYGRSDERMLPPDTGSGFIWRIRSITRYEERDGGVLVEIEAIALTRDIPASLSWLVSPVVNHLSINSLSTTLRETRQAVIEKRGSGALAACPNRPRTVALGKAGAE